MHVTHLDRYAVLGHPVAHSRSPFIHAAFAAQTAQALVYERVLCPLGGFKPALHAFVASGARGVNVTVPFKFDALAAVPPAQATARARLAGAANVLRFDGRTVGDWQADNSDGIGLVRDVLRHAGRTWAGQRVLLVGAGGAAAGVLGPVIEQRPACVHVANRTADRALALVQRHEAWAALHGVPLSASGLDGAALQGRFDTVLNASASSLAGAASPIPSTLLAPGALVVDLMYGRAAAPFLAWATAAGATARDGLGMLVEQAAEAFHFWRGLQPDTAPVLAALRARVDAGE